MSDYYLEKIADYLRESSRLSFEGHKRSVLRSRLEARLAELSLTGLSEYWGYLTTNVAENNRLYDLATTNETSFFRNPAQFSYLREQIIPAYRSRSLMGAGKIRILCAGCSTGEEPYSIAMTFLHEGLYSEPLAVEIVAGDISQSCLDEAATGVYQADKLKKLPLGYLDRYFESHDDGGVVMKKVRQLVSFRQLNLNDLMTSESTLSKDWFGSFDIIFCRNVMIYFSPTCQQLLVETLHKILMGGGYLFTGDAEPLHLFSHEFLPVAEAQCLIYKKMELSTYDDAF